ncbi:conserved hypothetical protein [Neospora caninum Liverpool]|uniref:Uncharacterized protein n=1 Tax=Neospora caninum (strain Liverpool) TaxID=572307 RepID=F0VN89_NEOCL|nr:conserved hypothetical protein [Neospora caninum Liverpool]CBZ55185.1 conserved hypothetical protein [Neospora caninum Liverpool]|eukprot:XP_003885213.1 conserved hypothetical protein [Neospora caninum Liverpool]
MESLKSFISVLAAYKHRWLGGQPVDDDGSSAGPRFVFSGNSSSFRPASRDGDSSSAVPASGTRPPRARSRPGAGLVVGGLEPSVEVDATTDDRGYRCRVNPVSSKAVRDYSSRQLALDVGSEIDGSAAPSASSSSSFLCGNIFCAPRSGATASPALSSPEEFCSGLSAAVGSSTDATVRSIEASRNYFHTSLIRSNSKELKQESERQRRKPGSVLVCFAGPDGVDASWCTSTAESGGAGQAPAPCGHRSSLDRSCSTASTSSSSSSWFPVGSHGEGSLTSRRRSRKGGSFRADGSPRARRKSANSQGCPFYSATLDAAVMDCSLKPLNAEEERVRARVRLPDLGADAFSYPLPPAIVYQSRAAEALDPALVGLQRSVLPKRDFGFEQQTKARLQEALKVPLTPRSVMALPLPERKKFLYNMLCCFCIELVDGVTVRQLTSTREYVWVHCRLSPDLKILQVDIRNGRVLEFPVDQVQAVYTLSRRQAAVQSDNTNERGASEKQQGEDDGERRFAFSPSSKSARHRRRGWLGSEESSDDDGESIRDDDLDNSSSGASEARYYSDEDVMTPSTPTYAQIPSSRRGRRAAPDREDENQDDPPQFIVVLDFSSRKLAFVFGDRTQAGTFELGLALLAKGSHQHPQSTLASIAAAADNFPYTPRAARALLHALAGTKDPASGGASSGNCEDGRFTRAPPIVNGEGVQAGGGVERDSASGEADNSMAWLTDSQAAAAVEAAAAALAAVEASSSVDGLSGPTVEQVVTRLDSAVSPDSKSSEETQRPGHDAAAVSGAEDSNGVGERYGIHRHRQQVVEAAERSDGKESERQQGLGEGNVESHKKERKPMRIICSDGREEVLSPQKRGSLRAEAAEAGVVQVKRYQKV